MSAVEHALKMQYIYRDLSNNVDDNYTSTLDLWDGSSPEEIIVFIKLFLMKLGLIPLQEIDKLIPFDLGDEKLLEDEESVENLLQKYNTTKEEDVEKIVNDDKNVDNFLEQLKSNRTMLKEVFKNYLYDTLTE